jgi:hypothetical protein
MKTLNPLDDSLCQCGHVKLSHEHHRRGTDCAFRSSCECRRYRPDTLALLRRLTGALTRGPRLGKQLGGLSEPSTPAGSGDPGAIPRQAAFWIPRQAIS